MSLTSKHFNLKKYTAILSVLLVIGLQSGFANNGIEISLLTCSAGPESFTSWGHSAIRILDKEQSIDVVYNFGLFDFNTPNFHLKFVQGKLKYKLGIQNTAGFINSYRKENRWVIEQKLNLSDSVEIDLINRLQFLYRPENRYYYYSFLKKNCTTELRDLIFNNTGTDFQNTETDKTYRILVNEYLQEKPWLKLGINLIFGAIVDKKINTYESMFLPDYLSDGLNKIKQLNNQNLILKQHTLNDVKQTEQNYPFLFKPIILFSLLLILVLIIKSHKIQLAIFFATGITGLSILLIWYLTDHPELKNNLNLLWCNPLYFISAILILFRKKRIQKALSAFLLVLIVIAIVVWLTGLQDYQVAYFPMVAVLIIYNLRIIKNDIIKLFV